MIQLDHDEDIARANGVEDHRRQAQQEGALYRRPHTPRPGPASGALNRPPPLASKLRRCSSRRGRAWPSDGRGQPHCVLNLPAFLSPSLGAMLAQLIVGSREVQGGDS